MFDGFYHLFDTAGFPPRWQCGVWTPAHGWTHIFADLAIFGAYMAIPCLLAYFASRRRDVPFLPVFWLFVVFILSCGFGHLVEATLFWNPWYRFSALVKVVTATASWVTVVAMIPLLPRALALPGLASVNKRLRAENDERIRLEARLRQVNEELEHRARQMHGMAQATLAVNSASSLDEVMQVLTDHARTIIGAHQAVTSFTRELDWSQAITGLSLSDRYAAFRTYETRPDGSGIYALVCETNRPMRLTQAELESHPRWRGFGKEASKHPIMRGWLAAPLVSRDGRNLGLIQLSDRCEGEFTTEDESLLVQLAHMGSVALEIRTFQNELERRVQERTDEVRFLGGLIEQSTHAFAAVDFEGRLIRFNHAFERLTGYSAPELLAMTYQQITPERWHEMERERVAELMDTGKPQHYEKEYQRKDGSLASIELMVDQYRDATGTPTCLYAFVNDITERKRGEEQLTRTAEELERSNAELEQFAYIASHDLQEPLRKVQSFSDMLIAEYRDALGDAGRDYLARMQNAAGRMQSLINDLLSYSRVTTRGRPFVPVDLAEIAREVLSDLEARLHDTGGQVDVGFLPVLEADPTQMRQVLQNLLGNALKYHRQGTAPHVGIHARGIDRAGNASSGQGSSLQWWEIQIEDNGIGFDEKYLDRIFAPFQRLHGRGEYEGTGIGLAICRRIIERHGGTITARSTPGRGACFLVVLPAHQPAGGTPHESP